MMAEDTEYSSDYEREQSLAETEANVRAFIKSAISTDVDE